MVDEGGVMESLLRILIEKRSHSRNNPLSAHAEQLPAAFAQPAAAPEPAHPGRATPIVPLKSGMIEPLSERELEVLKLLRGELSGPEIARELAVSLNTMRTHTKNIFNKLEMSNRRAAVRRPEELGLLPG